MSAATRLPATGHLQLRPIPDRTVRLWAWLDASVVLLLGLPVTARAFIDFIYRAEGWFGPATASPPLPPLGWLFVCLSGALVAVWVAARLAWPSPQLAFVDAVGRIWVAGLLIWFVHAGAPAVILVFVLTELGGAIAQLAALRPRWQAT